MSQLYLSGQDELNSELDLLLKDNLASMGSAVTQEQGSLAWCEAYAISNCQMAALNFIRLLSNQFTPSEMTVYARRFAAIYGLNATGSGVIPTNLSQLQGTIALTQALFGTPNNFTNVSQYIQSILGQAFIDIEFAPEIQYLATQGPLTTGQSWFSPLSIMFIRQWQPRDNQDHILMPTNVFLSATNAYQAFVQNWLPAYATVMNMQLQYSGNDGYGINSLGVQGNQADGYSPYGSKNTITAHTGNNVIFGNGACGFVSDLAGVNANGWQMPIEVVDDTGAIQTYHVTSVVNDNFILIKETILNPITNRSYRLLGIQMDSPYALDGSMLFNI